MFAEVSIWHEETLSSGLFPCKDRGNFPLHDRVLQVTQTPLESTKGVHPLETELEGEMREGYWDLKGHAENTRAFFLLRKYSMMTKDDRHSLRKMYLPIYQPLPRAYTFIVKEKYWLYALLNRTL